VQIAEHGYDDQQVAQFDAGQQSAVAYFPGYPFAVAQVARVTGDAAPAAMLTTVVSGLLVALLFWWWCARRLNERARRMALVLLLVYPYSWFLFGTGYGDALFTAAAIAAFLALERDRVLLAGLLGAVAAVSRPTGVVVAFGLIAVLLQRRNVFAATRNPRRAAWHKLRGTDSAVLLAGAGLAGWCAYLWVRFGDPLAFLTVQSAPGWDQGAGPKTWLKKAFFSHLLHDSASFSLRLVAQALATAAFLAAVPFVVRRFGWGYGLFTLGMIAMPALGTGDFQGMGRYLIGAFPVFAVVGERLAAARRPAVRPAVVTASSLLLVLLTSFFARGYYLT
jgi:hypothetical protein